MQPGCTKGLQPGLESYGVSCPISESQPQSHLSVQNVSPFTWWDVTALELPNFQVTRSWPCSETEYWFLSLQPVLGRDVLIGSSGSGPPLSNQMWPQGAFLSLSMDPEGGPLWLGVLPLEIKGRQVGTVFVYFYLPYNKNLLFKRTTYKMLVK